MGNRLNQAKEISEEFTAGIKSIRDFNQAELALIAKMGDQFRDWFEACHILESQGIVTVGSTGQPRTHPAVDIKNSAADRIEMWLRRLKLLDQEVEKVDALDELKKQLLGG